MYGEQSSTKLKKSSALREKNKFVLNYYTVIIGNHFQNAGQENYIINIILYEWPKVKKVCLESSFKMPDTSSTGDVLSQIMAS